MKLAIVGPGFSPIPPIGWGAVESLIWDYYIFLKKYHSDIDVTIVNEPTHASIIATINNLDPDIVHIQYDDHALITPYLKCKKVLLTSHYAYLHERFMKHGDGYYNSHFATFVRVDATILCLSKYISELYQKAGKSTDKLCVFHNGANEEVFRYTESPIYPDRSIYLAKIDYRKRQHVYQDIPNLYFAGNIAEKRFNINNPRYLGEWKKPYLYDNLTDYANLVLLSDGEAHPLVCCEALIAGLGLVVSEYASANLDTSLPFIDVIPAHKLDDIEYITLVIEENRKRSLTLRKQIREYGVQHFSWKLLIDKYANYIRSL